MSKMIHGRRHELEFYEPPTGNEWNDAIKLVLGIGHAYKCVMINEEKTVYIIEEVDIQQTLERTATTLSEYTRAVPVKLICTSCKMTYNAWQVLNRRLFDQRTYYYQTAYCPNCPPISTDTWLAGQGYYEERPEDNEMKMSSVSTTTLTADQLEKFE